MVCKHVYLLELVCTSWLVQLSDVSPKGGSEGQMGGPTTRKVYFKPATPSPLRSKMYERIKRFHMRECDNMHEVKENAQTITRDFLIPKFCYAKFCVT